MRRLITAAVVAALAVAAVGAGTTAASAASSSIATSSEFAAIKAGQTIDAVRKTIGASGTVTARHDVAGTKYDTLSVKFATAAKSGLVRIDFVHSSKNVWIVRAKAASWAIHANRTSDKATQAEFQKVTPGHSIDYARSTFGTSGTVTSVYDGPGYTNDRVTVEWPTVSTGGRVTLEFTKNSKGTWIVDTRSGSWATNPAQSTNKATYGEYSTVTAGHSVDFARSAFGSSGTISSYYDVRGTSSDYITIGWPTSLAYGVVWVTFEKSSKGAWVVTSRNGYFATDPVQTTDKATSAEFAKVRKGQSLDTVRATLGTSGTVSVHSDRPGYANDSVEILWPTPSTGKYVKVTFSKNSKGAWVVASTYAN